MSKADPPQPPNPQATAAAQTGTNVSTAIANAFLNNTNQTTPLGSLSYDPTGNYQFTDPANGQVYNIPRFTATQTLGPTQQQTQDQSEAAKLNLATLGNTQSTRLNQLLAGNIDLSRAGPFGDPSQISGIPSAQTEFGNTGQPLTSYGDAGQIPTTYGGQGDYQRSISPTRGQAFDFADVGSQQGQFGATPGSVFGFGDAGDITRSYGPQDDFSSDRQRVEQSLFSRLSPQLERERTNLEQRLADQGIRYGSTAYNDAMKDYNDRAAAQQVAVTQAGGAEQQRMMDMAAQRAGFQNAAQQQAYTQARGRGEFFNTAEQQAFQEAAQRGAFGNAAQQAAYAQAQGRGTFANQAAAQAFQEAQGRGAFANTAQQAAAAEAQQRGTFAQQGQQSLAEQLAQRATFANQAQQAAFQQAAARGGFANTALQQQVAQAQAAFNAQNAARAQYLQEQYALRNQPINEISALLSGSQVQQPQFMQTPQQQIPTTDYAGIINQNFQQQFQNYQTQQQAQNQLLGGILGAGGSIGAGLAFRSDRRAKKNIHRIGTVFAAEPQPVEEPAKKKLPVYEYSYKDDAASLRHIGPMAQDMEKVDPSAVGEDKRGVKYINAGRMMGSILRAA